jgi:hypothetical protein
MRCLEVTSTYVSRKHSWFHERKERQVPSILGVVVSVYVDKTERGARKQESADLRIRVTIK